MCVHNGIWSLCTMHIEHALRYKKPHGTGRNTQLLISVHIAQVPLAASLREFGARWSADAFRASKQAGPVQVQLQSGRIATLRHAWGDLMPEPGRPTHRRGAGGRVGRRLQRRGQTEQPIEELTPFEVQRKARMEDNQRKLQALGVVQVGPANNPDPAMVAANSQQFVCIMHIVIY